MKQLLAILALAFFSSESAGQTFLLTDTTYSIGETHRLSSFNWFTRWGYSMEIERKPIYDSIVNFMTRNPSVYLEVGFHTDTRASEKYNLTLTKKRAELVKTELGMVGADTTRIITVGYGETKPIHSDEYIASLTTEEEQEEAHQWNRREVLKIVEGNKQKLTPTKPKAN